MRFSSQEMGSSLLSLEMIFEAPRSELFRFKFSTLSSKILKIPEFYLAITTFEDFWTKFCSERKGKLSKYWSYISILPYSYPTVLSGGCSKWLFSCSFILFACWIWKLVKNGPEIMFTNFRNRFKKLIKLMLFESELDLIELIKFTIRMQSQSHGF